MIIWSGWGLLAIPVGFIGIMFGVAVDRALYPGIEPMPSWPLALGLLLAAAAAWWLGRRLNAAGDQVLQDPATGALVRLRRRHSLFFIPLQWWSIAMLAFAALVLTVPLATGPGARPARNGDLINKP